MIQATELPCGPRVILEPVENTEAVSIGFWQDHGSRDETEAEAGFSHFLEHMVFKGTRRRSAYQIAQAIDRVGGYLNAFTEKEVTCFYCTLPGESIELAVDVLADMLSDALLDEVEIEKEKAVVLNEISAADDNPEEKGQQHYLERLWGGHALSRQITGLKHQVTRIRRQELLEFYRTRFSPCRLVITASGKLEPGRLLQLLQERLPEKGSAWSNGRRTAPPVRKLWQALPDKFEQVQVYTGICFPSSKRLEEYYHELVLNTLFGESMSSRLFQRIREDEGLCYSVYSYRTYFTDLAMWTVYANTSPGTIPTLLRAVQRELARLRTDAPSLEEIEDAKSQLRGNMILSKEDMENRMKRLFRQHHLTGKTLEYEESLRLLGNVGQDDVVELIERRLRPEDFNLLAYGSRRLRKLPMTGFAF
ncbi:MAG: insulinase family protein [Spirochaetales bacterium]|nr:insulinase family protein [Spirochaetales bacterium]